MKKKRLKVKLRRIARAILRAIFVAIARFIIFNIEMGRERRQEKIDKLKSKFKYFRPTIKETMFGRSISWELRDKPLTDDELNNLQ